MPTRQRIEVPAPRILLTGFGPFPGVAVNASQRLAGLLARRARRRWPDARVTCATLPTEWQRGPDRLAALWRTHSPDIALHFGVSARAIGFEIEITARNVRADSDDARGARPPGPCHGAAGPATCASTLPARAIVAALAARGLPGCISDDAGTYLCNSILYCSLRHASATTTSRRPHARAGESPDILQSRSEPRRDLNPARGRDEVDGEAIAQPHSHRHSREGGNPDTPASGDPETGPEPGLRRDDVALMAGSDAGALVGFIHIPACLAGGGADGRSPLAGCPLDWNEALDGAMIALETTLAAR
jgi:pyroglutamyl-peptidase